MDVVRLNYVRLRLVTLGYVKLRNVWLGQVKFSLVTLGQVQIHLGEDTIQYSQLQWTCSELKQTQRNLSGVCGGGGVCVCGGGEEQMKGVGCLVERMWI